MATVAVGAVGAAGGTLATQEWVSANGGGGGSSSTTSVTYTQGDNSITIDPSSTNAIHFVGGLGGDDIYAIKLEAAMKGSDHVIYAMDSITCEITNDNLTPLTTKLQFPKLDNTAATPVSNTLNVPNSSGTIATEEWVKNYINTILLGGKW